ncbi:hypothetical protein ACWIGB_05335 [Streptomyces albidoflavus]
MTTKNLAAVADAWNAAHPVGTPVVAFPGFRPEDDRNCERLVTRTRTAAWVLSGHTPVVMVEGHGACISLTHVDPAPATDLTALADALDASAARMRRLHEGALAEQRHLLHDADPASTVPVIRVDLTHPRRTA